MSYYKHYIEQAKFEKEYNEASDKNKFLDEKYDQAKKEYTVNRNIIKSEFIKNLFEAETQVVQPPKSILANLSNKPVAKKPVTTSAKKPVTAPVKKTAVKPVKPAKKKDILSEFTDDEKDIWGIFGIKLESIQKLGECGLRKELLDNIIPNYGYEDDPNAKYGDENNFINHLANICQEHVKDWNGLDDASMLVNIWSIKSHLLSQRKRKERGDEEIDWEQFYKDNPDKLNEALEKGEQYRKEREEKLVDFWRRSKEIEAKQKEELKLPSDQLINLVEKKFGEYLNSKDKPGFNFYDFYQWVGYINRGAKIEGTRSANGKNKIEAYWNKCFYLSLAHQFVLRLDDFKEKDPSKLAFELSERCGSLDNIMADFSQNADIRKVENLIKKYHFCVDIYTVVNINNELWTNPIPTKIFGTLNDANNDLKRCLKICKSGLHFMSIVEGPLMDIRLVESKNPDFINQVKIE